MVLIIKKQSEDLGSMLGKDTKYMARQKGPPMGVL